MKKIYFLLLLTFGLSTLAISQTYTFSAATGDWETASDWTASALPGGCVYADVSSVIIPTGTSSTMNGNQGVGGGVAGEDIWLYLEDGGTLNWNGTNSGCGPFVYNASVHIDGTLNLTTTLTGSDKVWGAGTINTASWTGVLHVGDSLSQNGIGVFDFIGDATSSGWSFDLGGLNSGQFDSVNVTGTFTAGGGLTITHYGGFNPAINDEFQLITAGTISGTFASVNAPTGYTYNVLYDYPSAGIITAQVAAVPTPATALDFGGTTEYIDLPTTTNLNSSFTVEFWMKQTAINSSFPASVGSRGAGVDGWAFYTYGNSNFHMGSSTGWVSVAGSAPFVNDQWYHIAGVYQESSPGNGTLSYYIDGVLQGSAAVTGYVHIPGNPVLIGRHGGGAITDFEGEIDELRIWSEARCQNQIVAGKDCELNGNETNLLAYYDFNQGFDNENNSSETILIDRTSNGYDGTLNSFTLSGTTSNWLDGTSNGVAGSCTPVSQGEIDLRGNYLSISSGDNTPLIADGTDFGSFCTGGSESRTFKIHNTGTDTLWLTGTSPNFVTISGSTDFTISAQPANDTILPGDSTFFDVDLNLVSSTQQTATISILNSDCNEGAYSFDVSAAPTIQDRAVSGDTSMVCVGSASVELTGSDVGINYYVRNDADNTVLGGPYTGTGSNISLVTDELLTTTVFNVKAVQGAAVNVNGSQYVDAGDRPDVNFGATDAFTIEGWFRSSTMDFENAICSNADWLFMHNGTNLQFFQNTSNSVSQSNAVTINPGEWYHAAVSYDFASGAYAFYLNGVDVGTGTKAATPKNTPENLLIGYYVTSNPYSFQGDLDEIRIWGDIRTPTEIQNNMSIELTGGETDLLAYFPLNEGVGLSSSDLTGNASATLTNMDNELNWVPGFDGDCMLEMSQLVTATINPISDQPVSGDTSFYCSGSSTIDLASSEVGVNYYLRDDADNSTQSPAIAGTGSGISIPVSNVTATTSYNVQAEAGNLGNGLYFKQTTSDAISTNFDPNGLTNMTIEQWIKPISNGQIGRYLSGASNLESYISSTTIGSLIGGGSSYTYTGTFTYGQWHHIAEVYDGSGATNADRWKVYVDGVQVTVNFGGTVPATMPASGNIGIGGSGNGCCFGEKVIDEFRIWNTSRSASEIADYMYEELTGSETGLVRLYSFNEVSGATSATDSTGTSNATLGGAMDPNTSWMLGAPRCELEMSATTTVTINSIPQHTVSGDTSVVCSGIATIDLQSSTSGIEYYLVDTTNYSVVDGPQTGNGSQLSFTTGVVDSNAAYTVEARNMLIGTALDFDGSNDYVEVGQAVIPTTGDFTIELWAKAQTQSGYTEMLSQQGSGNGNHFYIGHNSDGTIRVGDAWGATGIAFPDDNTWHHFAVVQTATDAHLYIDGVLEASKGSVIGNPNAGTPLFRLGRQFTGGEYYLGTLDEVRVWNIARSGMDIADNMQKNVTGDPNIVAHFDFEDGTGSSNLTDISGNGFDGTLMLMDVNSDWVAGQGIMICNEFMNTYASVTIDPVPDAAVTSDTSFICPGDITNINLGSSEVGFDYYLRNDLNDTIYAGPVAGTGGAISINTGVLSGAIDLNVWAVNTDSCSGEMSQIASISLTPPPSIIQDPVDLDTICDNENTYFHLLVSDYDSIQWEYSSNGGISWIDVNDAIAYYNGAHNDTLYLESPNSFISDYDYRAKVFNCGGSDTSNTATLYIHMAPFVGTMGPTEVCENMAATFNATGAGGGATYDWSHGITNGSPSVVDSAGPYMVTVTDANGCVVVDSENPVFYNAPVLSFNSSYNPVCAGGSSSITASGGDFLANYNWNIGSGETQIVTPATDSTFYVTVTNGGVNSCVGVDSIVISVTPYYEDTVDFEICFGDTISIRGNNYWTDSLFSDTIVGVGVCDSIVWSHVIVNPLPIVDAGNDTTICGPGSVYFYITGAPAVQWVGGPFGNGIYQTVNFTNDYIALGQDGNGCQNYDTLSVVVNDVYNLSVTASICPGDSIMLGGAFQSAAGNYTDSLTSSGGCDSVVTTMLSFYPTYLTPLAISICPEDSIMLEGSFVNTSGVYYDTLVTINGCDSVIETTLSIHSVPTIAFTPFTPVCEDASPVALNNATPTGGVYNGIGIVGSVIYPSLSGPGTFPISYTYTTGDGCVVSDQQDFQVVAIPDVSFVATLNDICEGDDPFAMNHGYPQGGIYDGLGVSGNNFNPQSVGAGTHLISYTYVDSIAGCANTAVQAISVNEVPLLTLVVNNAQCNQSNGSAAAYAVGGSAPYEYTWSNGSDDFYVDNLPSGFYSVQVVDNNGCTNFELAAISDANGPVIAIDSLQSPTCAGDADGGIYLSITSPNGTPAIAWSHGEFTEDVDSLLPGAYEIIVIDDSSCTANQTFIVSPVAEVQLSANITQPHCNTADGSVVTNASGGTTPYSYNWFGGSTSNSITGIFSGIYAVSVNDANGCSESETFEVTDLGAPTILVTDIEGASCGFANGGVDVAIVGGIAPHTFEWFDLTDTSSVSTSQNLDNATQGPYYLEVNDANTCRSFLYHEIPAGIPYAAEICLVTVDSSTQTNTIVWEDPIGGPVEAYNVYRESTVAGSYTLIGTVDYDSLGVFVDEFADPRIKAWKYRLTTIDTCGNESDFSDYHKTLHLTMNVGLSNQVNLIWDHYEGFNFNTYYVYRHTLDNGWSKIDSLSSNVFSYTDFTPAPNTDSYYIEIKRLDVCTATKASNYSSSRSNRPTSFDPVTGGSDSTTVINPVDTTSGGTSILEMTLTNSLNVFPNPSNGIINVQFISETNGTSQVEIYDARGRLVITEQVEVQKGDNKWFYDLTQEESGLYHIRVHNNSGTFIRRTVIK